MIYSWIKPLKPLLLKAGASALVLAVGVPVATAQEIDQVFQQLDPKMKVGGEDEIFDIRVNDAWRAQGLRAGAFTILPSLELAGTYNSKVAATSAKSDSDFGVVIRPEISIRSIEGSNSIRAFAGGRLVRYAKHEDENIEELSGGISFSHSFSQGFTLNTQVQGGTFQEDRASDFSPAGSRSPIRYDHMSGRLGAVISPGSLYIAPEIEVNRLNYHDNVLKTAPGTAMDQDGRDITRVNPTLTIGYAVSPATLIFVGGEYNNRNYDANALPFGAGLVNRDSHGYIAFGGVRFQPSRLTRLEVAGGYQQQFYAAPLSDPDGLYMRANFAWSPRRNTVFKLSARREISESGALLNGGVIRTRVSSSVEHEVQRDLIVMAEMDYRHNRVEQFDRDDDRVLLRGEARYFMNRAFNLFMRGEGMISRSRGVAAATDYDRLIILAGLTARL